MNDLPTSDGFNIPELQVPSGGGAQVERRYQLFEIEEDFFQTEQLHAQKRWHVTGTKVRRISGTDLAKIRIPVPPMMESRRRSPRLTFGPSSSRPFVLRNRAM